MKYICAIDPSNLHSAYVICHADDLEPIRMGRNENENMYCRLVDDIQFLSNDPANDFEIVIEDMECQGRPLSKDTKNTIIWMGRLLERFEKAEIAVTLIRRSQERKVICPGVYHANDTTIRYSLIERFTPNVPNYGKGSKANPGWFYGFRADIWQAYAVAVTFHDLKESGEL